MNKINERQRPHKCRCFECCPPGPDTCMYESQTINLEYVRDELKEKLVAAKAEIEIQKERADSNFDSFQRVKESCSDFASENKRLREALEIIIHMTRPDGIMADQAAFTLRESDKGEVP